MFKIDVVSLVDDREDNVSAVVSRLKAGSARRGVQSSDAACCVVALAVIGARDLPDNECRNTATAHNYAEALVYRIRAHFLFERPDKRLIGFRSVCPADRHCSRYLIHLFCYLRSDPPTVTGPSFGTNNPQQTITRLQRAEEHLLEISRSRPECRLPEVPAPHLLMPDVSQLARDVRAPALADDDVMHVDQSDSSDTDTAPLPTQRRRTMPPPRQKQQEQQPKKRTTRAPPPAHSQRSESEADISVVPRKRARPSLAIRSTTIETAPSTEDGVRDRRRGRASLCVSLEMVPENTDEVGTASGRAAITNTSVNSGRTKPKGRRSIAPAITVDERELLEFYHSLDSEQPEQRRVAHTVHYARLRYHRQISADTFYKLLSSDTGDRSQSKPSPPETIGVEEQRDLATAEYRQLDESESEQTRVAFTLRHMQLRHRVQIDAKTLYIWLQPPKKKSRR